jgi:hypothetical protein
MGIVMSETTEQSGYEELDELIMSRAGWRHPDDYPESLFHYTSSAAFLSIIDNNTLWFSDFRYMNDLSELSYGIDLVKAAFRKRFDSEKDRDLIRLPPFPW